MSNRIKNMEEIQFQGDDGGWYSPELAIESSIESIKRNVQKGLYRVKPKPRVIEGEYWMHEGRLENREVTDRVPALFTTKMGSRVRVRVRIEEIIE